MVADTDLYPSGDSEHRDSSPSIRYTMIQQNSSAERGGSVWISTNDNSLLNGYATPDLSGCAMIENTATDEAGGVYVEGLYGNLAIECNTLTANTSATNGNSLYVDCGGYSNSPTVRNCILWGERQYEILITNSTCPLVEFSIIRGGYTGAGAGSGIITSYPLMHLDKYHLLGTNSPAYNTGTTNGMSVTRDIDNENRPGPGAVSVPEIGADEWVDIETNSLPDFWEKVYFGTNSFPDLDSDGDGLTNDMEWTHGTCPTNTDTDADGAPDGAEVDQETDPLDPGADTDEDGLGEHGETYRGTDEDDWDSDGDLMPDGWEVFGGLCPTNASDKLLDSDGDGVTNYWEYVYGTDPSSADSDLDGVEDGAELAQGSCPFDASDEGNPTNCVTISLGVGDSDQTDRWELHVGDFVRHTSTGFASYAVSSYPFVKGKSYEFSVVWIDGIKPEGPDYDYRARIDGLPTGDDSTNWLYGASGTAIHDPQLLLGYHGNYGPTPTNYAEGKSGTLYLPKVELAKLTFDGNRRYTSDDDKVIFSGKQEWTSPSNRTSVLFAEDGEEARINAYLEIAPTFSEGKQMAIRGTADDGLTFTNSLTFPPDEETHKVPNITANAPFSNVFDYISTISWELHIGDGGYQPLYAKDSTVTNTDINIYYVPNHPILPVFGFHDTVYYVVCRAMDGYEREATNALSLVWAEFTDLEVVAANRTNVLKYWKDGLDGDRDSTALLLQNGSGNCQAWSEFLSDCFDLSDDEDGSVVKLVNADRPDGSKIPDEYKVVVRNVNVNPVGADYGQGDYKWQQTGGTPGTGYWQKVSSVAGQGMPAPPPPYEQVWPCHVVLKVDDGYYDPSYGVQADTGTELENSILTGLEQYFAVSNWFLLRTNTFGAAELKEE